MKDQLGRRMKQYYEDPYRLMLPRGSYAIVRIDGRAFHTFTAELERPYSRKLADALDQAALSLCREMIGCCFAYGQSDEYSFLMNDAPLWFDGNVQKIASVSASVFTAAFRTEKLATFDARVFIVPQRSEVAKYFLWRQLDASANSLNMLASAHYSHADLLGKSNEEKHELLHAKSINWAKQPADFKRGRVVRRAADWEVDLNIPIFSREPAYLDGLIPM